MKLRKVFSSAAAGALALTLAGAGVANAAGEEIDEAPLFKWDAATGDYGSVPVPYSPHGDDTQVTIPVDHQSLKEELRSAWVATVFNLGIDESVDEAHFVEQYQKILDDFSSYNMNTMIFQVRPEQDAWYRSELGNPWSKGITTSGVEGTDPGFDPLAIMLDMTHEAGMEYHAWFNPYRVTNTKVSLLSDDYKAKLADVGYTPAEVLALDVPDQVRAYAEAGLLDESNFAVQNPELVLQHDEKFFFNPGAPEVRQHVVDTIMEVAENYDVDAIHFDDYFYPANFGSNNPDPATAPDGPEFALYGGDFPNTEAGFADWRRNNVDLLIKEIHDSLQAHNQATGSSVQWGISPAGIWNHKANDERGSLTPTGSSSTYLGLFADTYKWVKEDWLDYIMPQVYWSFTTGAAPYGELTRWWNDLADGTNVDVYIGHPAYKVDPGNWDAAFKNPNEIADQLRFNQKAELGNVRGSVMYSYTDMREGEFGDTARGHLVAQMQEDVKGYWKYPALVPAKPALSQGVARPADVSVEGSVLTWSNATPETSRYFIVYQGNESMADTIADPANIVARIWAGGEDDFTVDLAEFAIAEDANIYVTATNAAGLEWTASPVAPSVSSVEMGVNQEATLEAASVATGVTLTSCEVSEVPEGIEVVVEDAPVCSLNVSSADVPGNFDFQVTFTDDLGAATTVDYTVSVYAAPAVSDEGIAFTALMDEPLRISDFVNLEALEGESLTLVRVNTPEDFYGTVEITQNGQDLLFTTGSDVWSGAQMFEAVVADRFGQELAVPVGIEVIAPVIVLSAEEGIAGETEITVSFEDLVAGDMYRLELHSVPMALGQFEVPADGSPLADQTFTVPANATAGSHQVVLLNAAGQERAQAPFEVTAKQGEDGSKAPATPPGDVADQPGKDLAKTGPSGLLLLSLGLGAALAVLVGVALVIAPRRSRRI